MGGYLLPGDTINVQCSVVSDQADIGDLLKKGRTLIFFLSGDQKNLVGFIKQNKRTTKYAKTTFKGEYKNGKNVLYHTKNSRNPRYSKRKWVPSNPLRFRIKERYCTFYENGNMSREALYIKVFAGKTIDPFAKRRAGEKIKPYRAFVNKYLKSTSYFENGQQQEIIEVKYGHKKFETYVITADTTRYDPTGKITYNNKIIK
jgi:hypothetical protein